MKKVLITGGAKGIGAACCKVFAERGYFVFLNYFKSENSAKSLAERINFNGGMCEIFNADLTKKEQLDEMFNKIKKDYGFLDVLINNAGMAHKKLFLETSFKDWQNVFYVNLFTMFSCCKKILPSMLKHKKGKIINISSIWGEVGASCETIYSAAKAGVIGFTKALAKEVALSGINVNCIAPGVIKTNMLDELSNYDISLLKKKIPCERLGRAEDVAAAALFLAGEDSNYVNGEVLNVGGGFCL